MSKEEMSVTEKPSVSLKDPFEADPKIVTKLDAVIEALAHVTIDNLKGLFALVATNANDCRSIFTECAELYRKKYLTQAEDIRDTQGKVWSHLVNGAGALAPAFFGESAKIVGKAVGGTITAGGSLMSARNQSDGTYKSAQKDGLSQGMQNAYGDRSRAEQDIDKVKQSKEQAESALQQAKAAMMR